MGISLGGGRKRRSYANYKPPKRNQGPQSDPFRIVVYLALIAIVGWALLNPDFVRGLVAAKVEQVQQGGVAAVGNTPMPTDTPVNYPEVAQQAYKAGQLTEAINAYHEAGAAEPNNVDYPYQEARLLIYRSSLEYGTTREATLDAALDAANRAVLANPNSPLGYAILGKVRDWQGNEASGLNNVQRAFELDPNLPIVNSYLAEILVDLDRWDQATLTIEKAFQLDPNNVDVRRDYAYILESLGDYPGAQAHYEAAHQLEPRLPNLMLNLGRIYRQNGSFDMALEKLADLETLLPDNALVAYEIGRTYDTYIGDPTSAIENYEHAVELDAEYISPWKRLGSLYYGQGNYAEAIEAFEKALALGAENDVDVLYRAGLSYANVGECSKAVQVLQKARTLAADDERIIDLVNSGFETCSLPTPTNSPAPTATP